MLRMVYLRLQLVHWNIFMFPSYFFYRCLVKSLESLVLSYDMTVRDNDGVVVQFLYGEDGVNVEKSPFLQYNQYGFLMENLQVCFDSIVIFLLCFSKLIPNRFHIPT